MADRQFSPGDLIYREGDKSDFAYFIKSGQVEILKAEANGVRQVTVLGPGEVFGEMGVILDQRRSVTARAVDAVEVRAISRTSFIQAVNQQSDMARPVLKTLIARLHQEERPSAQIMAMPPPKRSDRPGLDLSAKKSALDIPSKKPGPDLPRGKTPVPDDEEGDDGGPDSHDDGFKPRPRKDETVSAEQFGKIRLLPASEELEELMEPDGIEIDELPFRIGRQPTKNEHIPTEDNDLSITDNKPYNLSRQHFAIEQGRRGLIVRDCGSHLGTMVNGVRIGADTGITIAILKSGDNEVVAGVDESPYRFTLRINPT